MASDFSSLGLDKYLRSTDSVANTAPQLLSALERDALQETSPYAAPTTISKGKLTYRNVISVLSAGASGAAQTSYNTNSSTPQNLDATRFLMNKNDITPGSLYLETIYRAGTSGETVRTFFMDLYDLTGSAVVANGTFSGTQQSDTQTPGVYPRGRSTTDITPSLAAGDREYILRYWGTSTPGTLFVDVYEARLVIDF